MANPLSFPNLVQFVARLADRVTALERRRAAPGVGALDDLDDTEVLYDHWTRLPKHGQALRWDTSRDSRFHGLASFADPEIEAKFFETDVTGAGSFDIGGVVVPDGWDVSRPCLVTATAGFEGDWQPVEATSSPDPITFVRPPFMTLQMYDNDPDRVDEPAAGFEIVNSHWPIMEPYTNASVSRSLETRSWLFLRGLPLVAAACDVDSAAAPGLTGSGHRIVLMTRCTRL